MLPISSWLLAEATGVKVVAAVVGLDQNVGSATGSVERVQPRGFCFCRAAVNRCHCLRLPTTGTQLQIAPGFANAVSVLASGRLPDFIFGVALLVGTTANTRRIRQRCDS